DWAALQGSGRDGRIREADVRTASAQPSRVATPSRRRRTIAERLRISRDRTVPVTLTTTLDATELVALRGQFKAAGARGVPASTDIVACVVAQVLTRHPHLAPRRQGDHETSTRPTAEGFDIGIAVHTDEGLLAPVLRAVGRKSLLEVAEESQALIERARAG